MDSNQIIYVWARGRAMCAESALLRNKLACSGAGLRGLRRLGAGAGGRQFDATAREKWRSIEKWRSGDSLREPVLIDARRFGAKRYESVRRP
jgi:hypothetical protein